MISQLKQTARRSSVTDTVALSVCRWSLPGAADGAAGRLLCSTLQLLPHTRKLRSKGKRCDRQSVCRLAFWCCTDNLQRLHKPLLQEPGGVCDGDVHSWDTDQSFDGAQTEEVFLLLFSGPQRLLLF